MATATYDRPAIFKDAWARARRAAAEAIEPVRRHIGAAMRAAWATAKAALGMPVKPAAPVPVQLDLVEFIAGLPPIAPAPRRFEMGPYTTVTIPGVDGEPDDITVMLTFADGTVRVIGEGTIYSEDYDGPHAVLQESLRVIEEVREAAALSVVQQPEPAPQETEEARLTARLAELERERDEARADFIAARRERMAIVAGDMEGDAGIAWTNEERAEADFDEATDRYEEAYQHLWRFTDIAA